MIAIFYWHSGVVEGYLYQFCKDNNQVIGILPICKPHDFNLKVVSITFIKTKPHH